MPAHVGYLVIRIYFLLFPISNFPSSLIHWAWLVLRKHVIHCPTFKHFIFQMWAFIKLSQTWRVYWRLQWRHRISSLAARPLGEVVLFLHLHPHCRSNIHLYFALLGICIYFWHSYHQSLYFILTYSVMCMHVFDKISKNRQGGALKVVDSSYDTAELDMSSLSADGSNQIYKGFPKCTPLYIRVWGIC
jgi:hypothetical protein